MGLSLTVIAASCASRNGERLSAPYPELLRQAGIQGTVHFRVVLDSLGVPRASTFQVLSSPNPGFNWGVRQAVLGARKPARLGGQTWEDSVTFRLFRERADSARTCRARAGVHVVCGWQEPIIHREELHE